LGLFLLFVLSGVFGVAKYLGYDDIWGRFKVFVYRLRRWRLYSQYRQVKEEDIDDASFFDLED
jgi:hypothetical protein